MTGTNPRESPRIRTNPDPKRMRIRRESVSSNMCKCNRCVIIVALCIHCICCSNLFSGSSSQLCSKLQASTAVPLILFVPQHLHRLRFCFQLVKLTVSAHPKGLPPLQAMKAWVLRVEEGLSWPEIQLRTTNVLGEAAGDKAVREAVRRIEAME